jgi:hypothetical protein
MHARFTLPNKVISRVINNAFRKLGCSNIFRGLRGTKALSKTQVAVSPRKKKPTKSGLPNTLIALLSGHGLGVWTTI